MGAFSGKNRNLHLDDVSVGLCPFEKNDFEHTFGINEANGKFSRI